MIRRILKSSLFKSTFLYALARLVNSSIPFLLLPVLTRYLSPADYGVVAMFGVLLSFAMPFTGASTVGAIARQYYDGETADMPGFISSCFLILAVSTAILGVLGTVFSGLISRVASFPAEWLWAVIVVAAAQYVNQVNLTLWQVRVKPIPYGIYQISQTALNFGFSLWLVAGLHWNWRGRVGAQVAAFGLFAVFGLVLLIRQGWLRFRADRKHLRTALAFGIPLVPHGLSGTIKTMADRVIITGMISIADTGLYAVGFQVAMVIGLLEDAVNKAYVPWLFERLKRGLASDKRRIVLMTYAYCAGLMGLAVLLGITAPRLLEIFAGPRFAGSSRFVIWIAIGFAFDGMYKMVVNYIFFARRTKSLPWITFSAALIGVGLNLFVIRRFGAVGAAYTFALMNALIFVAVWIVSSRIYPMPWNLRRSDAR